MSHRFTGRRDLGQAVRRGQETRAERAACRYVKRNALRAGLAERAEAWLWESVAPRRHRRSGAARRPLALPMQWLRYANQSEAEAKLMGELIRLPFSARSG